MLMFSLLLTASSLASSLRSGSFRRGPQQATTPEKIQGKDGAEVKIEDMLKGLLNPTAPLMSPFRVLYNLEVSLVDSCRDELL